jgi:hypothetical protein
MIIDRKTPSTALRYQITTIRDCDGAWIQPAILKMSAILPELTA